MSPGESITDRSEVESEFIDDGGSVGQSVITEIVLSVVGGFNLFVLELHDELDSRVLVEHGVVDNAIFQPMSVTISNSVSRSTRLD